MKTNSDNLSKALALFGKNELLRNRFLSLCRDAETILAERDFNVREEITGPIIDALHRDLSVLKKRLRSDIEFNFFYSSKIARDFVMSEESEPDHVWEPQTTRLLLNLVLKAQHVAIGGAYFGEHALLAAQVLRKDGGMCHCFELNREQIEMLRHNAHTNGLLNIVANQIGLWNTDNVYLTLSGDDSYASPKRAVSRKDPDTFPTITLNSYGNKNNISHFQVIMLDIEGGELAALKGADDYLKQPAGDAPHLIFEVHRNYVDWSDGLENTEIINYLKNMGYSLFAIRDYQSNVPMGDRPIEIIKAKDAYLEGPPHGFNMLGIKDERILDGIPIRLCSGVSPKLLFHRDPRLHQPLNNITGSI